MNLQPICRICTGENSEMTSIYGSHNFSENIREIFKVITDCASVQIEKSDGFSQQICWRCLEHLSQAYSFRKLCEDSDYKFRNNLIAGNGIEMKTEFCEETAIIYGEHTNEKENSKITKFSQVKEEQCKIEISNQKSDNEVDEELNASTFSGVLIKNINPSDLKKQQYSENYGTSTSTHSKSVVTKSSLPPCLVTDTKLPAEETLKTFYNKEKLTAVDCTKENNDLLGENQYKCEEKLPAGRNLNLNSKGKTDLLGEKHKCEICNKQFTSKRSLVAHSRLHTGEKPFKCGVCEKTFAQSSTLAKHTKMHTGEKLCKCEVCDKQFVDKSSLTIHARTHSGERPYSCGICDKRFASNGNLARHSSSHDPEKRYECRNCDKRFTYKNNLAVHMRLHTGETPFKCELCDKRFTHKNSLVTHVRLHTGERPYKCDFCDKKFIHRNSLAMHTRLHTGEKPYKCDVCQETFTQGIHLARHRKKKHSEDVFMTC